MTEDELDRLVELERKASTGPWYVRELDDEMSMGAVAVTRSPEISHVTQSMRLGTWPSGEIVAACLVQSPPYAMTDDNKFDENAELIAAVRNALPELLRLARLALKD